MNKILISSCTGVGNMILKTPFINSLQENFGNPSIDMIIGYRDRAENIFENEVFINERVPIYKKKKFFSILSFVLSIRNKKYDYIFLPFDDELGELSKVFIALLSGSTLITHYFLPSFKHPRALIIFITLFLLPRVKLVPFIPARHEVDLNLDLIQSLKCYPVKFNRKTQLNIIDNQSTLDKFGLQKNNYIIFQLSARSGMPTPKKWPLKKFIELFDKIKEYNSHLKIVTIGNQADFDAEISEFIKLRKDIVNSAGNTSILEAACLLKNAKVSIVHDSGAMHIANAVSANTIALLGPTDISRTGPLDTNTTTILSLNESTNSMFNFRMGEEAVLKKFGPDYCMSSISSEEVFQEVLKRIGS
jgi:ADP-heptose:LPS heptosyltransferase